MTPYHQGVFSSQEKPKPPPPDIIEQEEEHKIEEIVEFQKHHGNLEYLIYWQGYLQEEREWKKTSELRHAQDAIKEFHRKNSNAPRLPIKVKLHFLFDSPEFLEYQKYFNRFPNKMFEIPTSSEPSLSYRYSGQLEVRSLKGGNETIISLFHTFTYHINYYLLLLHYITPYLHPFHNSHT